MKPRSGPSLLEAAALTLALLFWPICPRASAQGDLPPAGQGTVAVSGTGRIGVTPDRATVSLGVETEAPEASAALLQNSRQMQKLIEALQAAGLQSDAIQTQNIQLRPRYEQPGLRDPPGSRPNW